MENMQIKEIIEQELKHYNISNFEFNDVYDSIKHFNDKSEIRSIIEIVTHLNNGGMDMKDITIFKPQIALKESDIRLACEKAFTINI